MTKLYTLVCLLAITISAFAAREKAVTFTLYDLTHEALNASYTDSEGNSIKIETHEPTYNSDPTFLYRATVDNPLVCIGQSPQNAPINAKYTTAILNGNARASTALSPSILITVAGDNEIKEIELLGSASSGGTPTTESELICAFSSTNLRDDSFEINWDYDQFTTTFSQAGCSDNNKRALLPGTKYIKLIATNEFGFATTGSFACTPMIHAIRIYAMATVTGINEEQQDAIEIKLDDRNLTVSEVVDLSIFSLTGIKVLELKSVQDLDLSRYASGVYIVKAKTQNGQEKLQKILLR